MALYNTPQSAAVAASSSGDNSIVAAQSGKKIKVFAFSLGSAGTVAPKWRSGTTDKTGAPPLVVNGQWSASAGDPNTPLFETASGEALVLNLSAAIAVSGFVTYRVEA